MEKHFDNSIDDDILFGISEIGYTNVKLGMEWLRHSDKQTASRRKGKYRMLVFDGHGSHLTDEFTYYCWEHNIIPFRLPAYSTHLLQPLDIDVFQPFKHWHQVVLYNEVRYGAFEFSKVDFLAVFQEIHDRTFKKRLCSQLGPKQGYFHSIQML
jgi:hypothetical protein